MLVLCGWKLYFTMYHPMHKGSKSKNFVGFDDSDSGSDSEKELKEVAFSVTFMPPRRTASRLE